MQSTTSKPFKDCKECGGTGMVENGAHQVIVFKPCPCCAFRQELEEDLPCPARM